MDWMYKKDEIEQKEYLLGKKVGAVPSAAGPNTNIPSAADIPGALFKFDNERAQHRATSDMQAKMREDPLYQIRKSEEDAKKAVFSNPVKMKKLQKMAEERQKKQMKKEKKKKKKKHKRASSDEASSDDELIQQYLAILKKKKGKESKKGRSSSQDGEWVEKGDRNPSSSPDREAAKPQGAQRVVRQGGDSDDGEDVAWRKQSYGLIRSRGGVEEPVTPPRRRERSASPKDKKKKRRERSPEDRHRRRRSRSRSPVRRTESSSGADRRDRDGPPREERKPRKPLSAEEKARRLAEMQENALDRDRDRKTNVARYREEDEKEEKSATETQADKFLNRMMAEHASGSSVSERIRRNKFNIQRTRSDLDKNAFHKK